MRVVCFLISAPPLRFIGAEMMTVRMLHELQSRGHQVTVYGRNLTEPHSWGGIDFQPYVEGTETSGCLVFHADWFEPSYTHTGPRVAVCHNERIAVQVGIINGQPNLVTVNSEAMRQSLGGIVLHPPVAPADLVSGGLVTVVNLEHNKCGPFWKIAKNMPDTSFLAVRGGYGEQVEKTRPNVQIIDHVPSARMDEAVWSRTRVLLVPSLSESWSMTASEAMMRGIPVVASNLPGLVENIGDGGLTVAGNSPQAWADAISEVLGDWPAFSARARQRAIAQSEAFLKELDEWCEAVEHVAQSC